MAEVLPLISTSFIALSAILVAIGWILIVNGKREAHQRVMVSGAIAAVLFFIIYLSKTFFVGNTPFNGPDDVKIYYLIFLLCHIVLSMVSAVMGVITLTLAFKGSFFKHRRIGRPTAIIWFITAISGITVYYLLYIKYPVAGQTHLWDAIFG